MSDLFWLTGEQMARLQPYFPKSHGRERIDDPQLDDPITSLDLIVLDELGYAEWRRRSRWSGSSRR